jgi:hypothetical protein
MLTSLAGIQSLSYPYPLEKGMKLLASHEVENEYQEHGPAIQLKHEGHVVGYLPLVHTLHKRIVAAKKRQDLREFSFLQDKINSVEYIRDQVYTELFRNKAQSVEAEIYSVYLSEEGEVRSIVVQFDYM